MISETMWAVKGAHGLYTGTWLTRSDAIRGHTTSKCYISGGRGPEVYRVAVAREWRCLKRQGDRAVKVQVTEITND